MKFGGVANEAALFLQNEHLLNTDTWKKFVDVFRSQPDSDNHGWRGEYWGKMMRGAALIYQYTQSDALYDVLTNTVLDLLTVAEQNGRVSSYKKEGELTDWDLWCRKYVLLGLQYYLDVCRGELLKEKIVSFMSNCADDIIAHIGPEKKEIKRASRQWFGLNSSSILEPMVRLYRLTSKKSYLDFATYIVNGGGAKDINVFALALENRLLPYQYGVSKAYELTSCFEGLLAYYEVTGIEKHKTAVLNYAKALLDTELSIIGSAGITHELFDHTKTRQTITHDDESEVMQETCVTVTLMKFFARVLHLTEDSSFADAIETAFYNAYLGALNTNQRESPYMYQKYGSKYDIKPTILPFDSYSPLTPGKRGMKVGGHQILPDYSYYGCCAAIGAAGVGVFLQNAVTLRQDCLTVNFYEAGSVSFIYQGTPILLTVTTNYPTDGAIKITVSAEKPIQLKLKLRTPAFTGKCGYTVLERTWHEDEINLCFDMTTHLHFPITWEEDTVYTDMSKKIDSYYTASPVKVTHKESDDCYVAVTRGPLVLAADSRTGKNADSVFPLPRHGTLAEDYIQSGVPCLLKMKFTEADEEPFYLVDYAHAGRDWSTPIAAWLPTKK